MSLHGAAAQCPVAHACLPSNPAIREIIVHDLSADGTKGYAAYPAAPFRLLSQICACWFLGGPCRVAAAAQRFSFVGYRTDCDGRQTYPYCIGCLGTLALVLRDRLER
jgi:hypothetical protein